MKQLTTKKSLLCMIVMAVLFMTGCSSVMDDLNLNYMQKYYYFSSYDKNNNTAVFINGDDKIMVTGNEGQYLISTGAKEYTAKISGTKDNFQINVETPEKNSVFYNRQGSTSYSGDNGNNDNDLKLVDGFVEKVLPAMEYGALGSGSQFNVGIFLFAILCIIAGVVGFANPKLSFMLGQGWKFKNVEPSDGYLMLLRIGGLLSIVTGIVLGCVAFQ